MILISEHPIQSEILYSDKLFLFEYLMKDKKAIKNTAKFINSALSIREFLITNHRNALERY